MTKKRLLLSIIIALAAGFIIYIIFPLTSRKWDIRHDEDKIDEKKKALDTLSSYPGTVSNRTGRRPNIIVILADDLGKTDISLYGSPHVSTPHIDSIGTQGVIFTNAYCTASICSPSRSSLLTGRYQQRYGNELQIQERYPKHRLEYFIYKYVVPTGEWKVRDMERYPSKKQMAKQGPPLSEIMLPELLKTAGYNTALIGKWHQGWAEEMVPNSRGFDYQYGFYEAYSLFQPVDTPDIVNSKHDYFADKHIWHKGRKGTCAIMRNNEVIEEDRYITFAIAEEAVEYISANKDEPFLLYLPFSAPHTPLQAPQDYYDKFSGEPDHNKRVYYAMISALDDAVGTILQSVSDNGLEEDTLIIFASDNGGAVYSGATENYPYKGGKFTLFDGGLAVPMMMMWKDTIRKGVVDDSLVSLMDIFTTSADAAGAPQPEDRPYDGISLLRSAYTNTPVLRDPPLREALFFRSGFNKAVRYGDWKLIVFGKDKRTELYNIAKDKEETLDLADKHPEIIDRLLPMIENWETELSKPLWPSVMDYRATIAGRTYNFQL